MRGRTRKRKKHKKKLFKRNFSFFKKSSDIEVTIPIPVKTIKMVVIFLIIAFVLLLISVSFAILNLTNNGMAKGIYLNGIDISNMTREEVFIQFEETYQKKLFNGLDINYNNEHYNLDLGLLEINYNFNEVLDQAYSIGRSGNVIIDNFTLLKTIIFKDFYQLEINYNEKNLESELLLLNNKLPDKFVESDYYIEDDQLIINKELSGIVIDQEKMIENFEHTLNNFSSDSTLVNLPFYVKSSTNLNLETIKTEIYIEAKDAYFTESPFKIYPSITGVEFKLSDNENQAILDSFSDNNEYVLPLKITQPNITTDKLSIEAFPNTIGEADSRYDIKNSNRVTNLKLAGDKINEYIISPGEEFSYNKIVGQRTIAAGYKEAPIYVGGQVVDGLGGGICQISSLLYNAVLEAGLEITERHRHGFLPSYADPGFDATVVYGSLDFKFINNRTYPIKIQTKIGAGVANIKILGIREDYDGKDYFYEYKIIDTIKYETEYLLNTELDENQQNTLQYGLTGYIVETYKIYKENSVEVSRELLYKDQYSALNQIIEVGELPT